MLSDASIRFPNLGIVIEHLKSSVTIFGFEIAFYGIIIGLGMLGGLVIACKEAKRTGQDPEIYIEFCIYAIVSAIIGCRVYYVIFQWDYYKDHLLEILNLRQGGLAIYGGIIGALICLTVYTKIKKVSWGIMADTAVLGLVFGQIVGRWGNFFNMEAFGGYSDGLLAMQINVEQASYTTAELLEKVVTVDGVRYIQVHPTFLYESLWNVGVLILLLLYRRHKKFKGEVFLVYVAGYGLGRAWIEGLRTDQLILPGTGIPVSQALSIVLVVLAVLMIIYKRKKSWK